MRTSTYTVTGMTCEHCVKAVTEEVLAIPGVTDVSVSLADRALVISSAEPVELALVTEAVDEAGGYTVEPA